MGSKSLSTNVLGMVAMVAVVLWATAAAAAHALQAESTLEGIWVLNQDLSDTPRAPSVARSP